MPEARPPHTCRSYAATRRRRRRKRKRRSESPSSLPRPRSLFRRNPCPLSPFPPSSPGPTAHRRPRRYRDLVRHAARTPTPRHYPPESVSTIETPRFTRRACQGPNGDNDRRPLNSPLRPSRPVRRVRPTTNPHRSPLPPLQAQILRPRHTNDPLP
jgi:hypothetical protein